MSEKLNGIIERVTFHSPEKGFAVLRVKVKGREELVTLIGKTTSVANAIKEHHEYNIILSSCDLSDVHI